MTTAQQQAANRRNAVKSTGPKTPEGKAVVALNAMKHGLLSRHVRLPDEDEAALVELGKRQTWMSMSRYRALGKTCHNGFVWRKGLQNRGNSTRVSHIHFVAPFLEMKDFSRGEAWRFP